MLARTAQARRRATREGRPSRAALLRRHRLTRATRAAGSAAVRMASPPATSRRIA